jgi:predicted deacylase
LIQSFRTDDSSVQGFRGTVTLVPIVNESAFLRGHRCGDDGKDLARTCPGREDGTVTEQTAWALSELIRSADYFIDLHTGGTELSVYPLAGYVMHANEQVLSDQRRMAKAFNLPAIWGTSPHLEGRSLSVARDCNVPAIYCEYLGSATCLAAGIDAYVDGCLNVMAELKMLDRAAPLDRVTYVVEDTNPGSGHMQVCNPAPCTGYFHTSFKPGDRIRSGDVMGIVIPLDQTEPKPIIAEQAGIVLVLRTFPRVQQGDSVGVILDV